MTKINIDGCHAEKQLFHNEEITVYHKNLSFNDIKYWRKNLRTLLAFEVLEVDKKTELENLEIDEITKFLLGRSELELNRLSNSIKMNGVRVPLIIKDDGTLLDGNRRYFACANLYYNKYDEASEILNNIPTWIIKSGDLSVKRERKILAEANFVKDLKVPWTLDVKAMVIADLFKELTEEEKKSEAEAFMEIENIYSLKKNEAKSYIDTIKLTEEYIGNAGADNNRKFKLRESVLRKFVYFWEFRNKALHGRGALDEDELNNVKPLFFKMMENNRLKNIKQVEPMIKSCREKDLWNMLCETGGTKIEEVVIFYNERKKIKSSEDKIRHFLRWLRKEKENTLTKASYSLLDDLKSEIIDINKEP